MHEDVPLETPMVGRMMSRDTWQVPTPGLSAHGLSRRTSQPVFRQPCMGRAE